jgi:hypothetical protein
MARIFRHLTLLGLSWALPAASAQQETTPERRLNFTVFSAQPISGLAYRPSWNAALCPLTFYPTARSPRYDYRGPDRISLLDIKSGTVLAVAVVPPRISSALFLLTMDGTPGGEMRYRVRVIDDSVRRQAPGELHVLNYSGLMLSGTVNRRPVTLADGHALLVPIGISADIQLRTAFNGKSYQAYADSLRVEQSGRALLILLPPYRRGALEVQSRLLLDVRSPDRHESTEEM